LKHSKPSFIPLLYALVEASDSAGAAKILVDKAGLSDRIEILKEKIENVELPELVDIIISEPIGFLLVHERMLDSYCIARQVRPPSAVAIMIRLCMLLEILKAERHDVSDFGDNSI
jgi:hypothetical protein